nr:uncharacterized protein LOC109150807 [Ipomoea batatas]
MTEETLSRWNSEEQDLLERSTKKTKMSIESPMGEASLNKKDGTSEIVANETAGSTSVRRQTELDLISGDEEEDPDDTIDSGCPVIRLTKEKTLRLRSKWK